MHALACGCLWIINEWHNLCYDLRKCEKIARAKNKLRWWWILWLCIHGIAAATIASRHNHHTNLSLILTFFFCYIREEEMSECATKTMMIGDEEEEEACKHETSDTLCACMWRRYFRWWEVGLFYSSTASFSPSRICFLIVSNITFSCMKKTILKLWVSSQQHQYQLIELISSLINFIILLQSQCTILNFHRIFNSSANTQSSS